MNILQITSSRQWGGCEKRCVQEIAWLRHNGHQAWLACDSRGQFFQLSPPNVQPFLLPLDLSSAGNFFTIAKLFQMVREKKIDVVHTHEGKDAQLCFWLHLAGVPVIRSRHWAPNPKLSWAQKLYYRHSSRRFIAASKSIYQVFIKDYGLLPEQVAIVGEGAEAPPPPQEIVAQRKAFRDTWGIPQEALVFAVIGIIRGEKGQIDFIEAAAKVLEHHPEVYFAVIGVGTGNRGEELKCIDRLRQLTQEKGNVARQIIMTGFYPQVSFGFSAADVIVIPSHSEAQSKVAPEAMSFGRAIIATRVGGLPEIITDGENGLLIPNGDVLALSQAMIRLVEYPNELINLGQAALLYAQAKLQLADRIQELLDNYTQCIKNHRPCKPHRTNSRQIITTG